MRKLMGYTENNEEIYEYTIKNESLEVSVLNFGATITKIILNNGLDVVLGYEDVRDYLDNGGCLGSTIVPSANRIKGASFEIDGVSYSILKNDGENNLHSHNKTAGWKKIWDVQPLDTQLICSLQLHPEDDYFPGNRSYKTIFTLVGNQLQIEYQCVSDEKTLFNPTQHSYFNLNGHSSGSVLDHQLVINADSFTETDENKVPTGKILPVENTPMDFSDFNGKRLGQDIGADYQPLIIGYGYDHNYCINDYNGEIKFAAWLSAEKAEMKIYTNSPGIQIYTGNYLGSEKGKGNIIYTRATGVALETQLFPDCVHHNNFKSSVIEANQQVSYQTIFAFWVK